LASKQTVVGESFGSAITLESALRMVVEVFLSNVATQQRRKSYIQCALEASQNGEQQDRRRWGAAVL
jgi:hypothetical protein